MREVLFYRKCDVECVFCPLFCSGIFAPVAEGVLAALLPTVSEQDVPFLSRFCRTPVSALLMLDVMRCDSLADGSIFCILRLEQPYAEHHLPALCPAISKQCWAKFICILYHS